MHSVCVCVCVYRLYLWRKSSATSSSSFWRFFSISFSLIVITSFFFLLLLIDYLLQSCSFLLYPSYILWYTHNHYGEGGASYINGQHCINILPYVLYAKGRLRCAESFFFSCVRCCCVYIEKRRRSNIYSLSPLFSKEIKK